MGSPLADRTLELLSARNVQRSALQRCVIVSFRDAETATICSGQRSRRLPGDVQAPALRKLRILNKSKRLDDLRVPPGDRLETFKGNRNGRHSTCINDQWRICFVCKDHHAHEVEIIDYH
jgi:proteic killer suppression protein